MIKFSRRLLGLTRELYGSIQPECGDVEGTATRTARRILETKVGDWPPELQMESGSHPCRKNSFHMDRDWAR
jgi:hypothetical protein